MNIIVPHYPNGKRGRPPLDIEHILRMYLLQTWFNLPEPATEDTIYDSHTIVQVLCSLQRETRPSHHQVSVQLYENPVP